MSDRATSSSGSVAFGIGERRRVRALKVMCKTAANVNGIATCVYTIPAGPIGVHPITVKGRGPSGTILYSADFVKAS